LYSTLSQPYMSIPVGPNEQTSMLNDGSRLIMGVVTRADYLTSNQPD